MRRIRPPERIGCVRNSDRHGAIWLQNPMEFIHQPVKVVDVFEDVIGDNCLDRTRSEEIKWLIQISQYIDTG